MNNEKAQFPKGVTQETRYLLLIKDILNTRGISKYWGLYKNKAVFIRSLEFDLSASFPLLTTKKIFWRGVVEELIWFLKGSTSSYDLSSKGIHIWDHETESMFGPGDLGPIYGFQWKHWGANYISKDALYKGIGIDQITQISIDIRKKLENQSNFFLTAWNCNDIHKMALSPCHMFAQFILDNNSLSCVVYQRAADVGLGLPFNIASYALLLKFFAHIHKIQVGKLVIIAGDTHIYNSHISGLSKQILRTPKPFPDVTLEDHVVGTNTFNFESISLKNYNPEEPIHLPVVTDRTINELMKKHFSIKVSETVHLLIWEKLVPTLRRSLYLKLKFPPYFALFPFDKFRKPIAAFSIQNPSKFGFVARYSLGDNLPVFDPSIIPTAKCLFLEFLSEKDFSLFASPNALNSEDDFSFQRQKKRLVDILISNKDSRLMVFMGYDPSRVPKNTHGKMFFFNFFCVGNKISMSIYMADDMCDATIPQINILFASFFLSTVAHHLGLIPNEVILVIGMRTLDIPNYEPSPSRYKLKIKAGRFRCLTQLDLEDLVVDEFS